MPSIRSIFCLATLLLVRCWAQPDQPVEHAAKDLKRLVEELPHESLDAVLHDHLAPKYRDGVFENIRHAIDTIHSDDPVLATRVVDWVIQDLSLKGELKKRQNGTVATTTTAQLTTPPPVTTTNAAGSTTVSTPDAVSATTQTGVLVPIVVSSTNAQGSVVAITTSAFETSAPTSVDVPLTTTNAQGSTITTSTRVPAAVITSTNANGQLVTTTSPLASVAVGPGGSIVTAAPAFGASSAPMSAITTTDQYGNSVVLSVHRFGEVITTTDARGRTVTLTYTPGGGAVSQLVLQTTSLPNGQRSTITSLAVVGGVATETSNAPGATGTRSGSGKPGLQSGVAAPTGRYLGEVAALVGGAVGVAALL